MAPIVSPSHACAWFYANSGYEESKYSLALADWLPRSRARTEEQMTDLEGQAFAFEWRVLHGCVPGDGHIRRGICATCQRP